MPRLWFSSSDLPRLRARATTGWPARIAAAAIDLAKAGPPAPAPADSPTLGAFIEAAALAFTLTGERRHAHAAADAATALLAGPPRRDLGAAAQLHGAVIACDLCGHAWPAPTHRALTAAMIALVHRLAGTDLSPDNPDNPFNNWWGVTHSATALAALCLLPRHPELRPLLDIEHERVRTYLLNYGDHGHYYEGTGYGFYAMSHWAPYVLAARHASGRDPADLARGLPRLPSLAHALTVARPQTSDTDEPAGGPARLGMRVAWNDDGGGWPGAGIPALLLALAPAADLPGLRWLHDRLTGPRGDRSDAIAGRGLLWSFLYYPAEIPARRPRAPLACLDQHTGLVVLRNRYQNGDDCVFATYAKTYHGGGHVQEDLGSWRFQGLGAAWAQAGGQAKSAAHFQCVVTRDGRRNDGRHGQISYYTPAPVAGEGGSVSLRLGPASGSKVWDRHFAVDYSGATGVPALLGLVDRCWHDEPADWTWSLCFPRGLQFTPLPAENGFRLASPNGASLVMRFGAPANLVFTLHESPASERTFSSGGRRVYPGVPYITAAVRAERTAFCAVATLQRGRAPRLRWERTDPDLPIGVVGGRRVTLARGKWFHGPLRIEPGGRL